MNPRALAKFCFMFVAPAFLVAPASFAQTQDASAALPGVTVGKGWTRTTPGANHDAPAYFTIHNTSDTADTLLSATCPIARDTQLVGADDRPVNGITIKAGATLTLDPGGTHVLLEKNRFRLFPKALVPCSVNFRNAGSMMLYLHVEPHNARTYHKSHGTPVDH